MTVEHGSGASIELLRSQHGERVAFIPASQQVIDLQPRVPDARSARRDPAGSSLSRGHES